MSFGASSADDWVGTTAKNTSDKAAMTRRSRIYLSQDIKLTSPARWLAK
jgi:hypothetical protein